MSHAKHTDPDSTLGTRTPIPREGESSQVSCGGENLKLIPWERFMELELHKVPYGGREVQSDFHSYQQIRGTLQKEQRQRLASHSSAAALTGGVLLPEDAQWAGVHLQRQDHGPRSGCSCRFAAQPAHFVGKNTGQEAGQSQDTNCPVPQERAPAETVLSAARGAGTFPQVPFFTQGVQL